VKKPSPFSLVFPPPYPPLPQANQIPRPRTQSEIPVLLLSYPNYLAHAHYYSLSRPMFPNIVIFSPLRSLFPFRPLDDPTASLQISHSIGFFPFPIVLTHRTWQRPWFCILSFKTLSLFQISPKITKSLLFPFFQVPETFPSSYHLTCYHPSS